MAFIFTHLVIYHNILSCITQNEIKLAFSHLCAVVQPKSLTSQLMVFIFTHLFTLLSLRVEKEDVEIPKDLIIQFMTHPYFLWCYGSNLTSCYPECVSLIFRFRSLVRQTLKANSFYIKGKVISLINFFSEFV